MTKSVTLLMSTIDSVIETEKRQTYHQRIAENETWKHWKVVWKQETRTQNKITSSIPESVYWKLFKHQHSLYKKSIFLMEANAFFSDIGFVTSLSRVGIMGNVLVKKTIVCMPFAIAAHSMQQSVSVFNEIPSLTTPKIMVRNPQCMIVGRLSSKLDDHGLSMSARSGPRLFGGVLHICLLSSWSESSALCCLGCPGHPI